MRVELFLGFDAPAPAAPAPTSPLARDKREPGIAESAMKAKSSSNSLNARGDESGYSKQSTVDRDGMVEKAETPGPSLAPSAVASEPARDQMGGRKAGAPSPLAKRAANKDVLVGQTTTVRVGTNQHQSQGWK